jgi:hypothetical protein
MGYFVTAGGGTGGGTVQPPLSFGIGLTQTGLIVDLDPAEQIEIGGIYEIPNDGLQYARQYISGIPEWVPVQSGGFPFMGANPPPPVPPAVVVVPGTLWWRTTDGQLFVYYNDGTKNQWVTASPTGEIVGVALVFPAPPMAGTIHAATNGVSYLWDGVAWIAQDETGGPVHIGPLPPVLVAPATDYEPGTLWWRNDPDGILYIWYDDGTSSQWVPAVPVALPEVNPAGNDPSQIGIVWVPPRSATQGLELLDGYLTAPLATPDMPGVINEPEVGDVEHVRVRDIATGVGKWVAATTGGGIGDVPVHPVQAWARANGRWVDVPAPLVSRGLSVTDNVISLDVATGVDLGGVFVPFNQGLELTPVGGLSLAPATPEIIGGLLDAPRDDTGIKTYMRKWGQWVEAEAGNVEIATATTLGVVFVPFNEGLELTQVGGLSLARATPETLGGLLDAPRDDTGTKTYMRKWGEWVEAVAGNVEIATATRLGVVFVPFNEGLELTLSGGLSLARARPDMLGGLFDAPEDNTGLKAWARRWGEWVPTLADAPDDEKLYGRQYSGLGTPADPKSMRWMEAVAPIDLELISNNKVDRSGDTMQGGLYLPRSEIDPNDPGGPTLEYPNDVYHAVPKWYCDANAGGLVVTDINAPTDAKDGQLWWQSDTAGLYLFFDDGNSSQWVQVNGTRGFSDADVIHDAPVDDTVYGRLNKDWHPVNVVGDFKWGFQAADHEGWIKLDGRPLAQLNARQSANASALGFATAIPDATGKVPMQNGLPLGDSSGTMSRTLSQANLPNISLTADLTGAHIHTAGSAGSHQHRSRGGVAGSAIQFEDMGGTGAWENWGGYTVIGDTGDLYKTDQYLSETGGAHTHATDSQGAHTHVVPLGGTALPLDITPASLAVTAFIFLGR